MSRFSTDYIDARSWVQPNIDPSTPTDENLGERAAIATGLENPWFTVTVQWSWPTGPYWDRFCIVRTTRSPAVRREEGQVMVEAAPDDWQDYDPETKRPVFDDPMPLPGEWIWYTIFVLDGYRVWRPAGSVAEIGPRDYGWTLRLPELLPGAAVSDAQGVTHPADQSNDLVQFLQSPAGYLDRAVTLAEAAQYFWDPLRCPPQMLHHIGASWGYRNYDDSIGIGRIREILSSLIAKDSGAVRAIQEFASGAMGSPASAIISNNLMLGVNDSSFEGGTVYQSGWEPIYTVAGDNNTRMEVRSTNGIVITLPPNVLFSYYLYIPTARTIKCGSSTVLDEFGEVVLEDGLPKREFDPVKRGIPVAEWEKVRMGCYAVHGIGTGGQSTTTNKISMGMDFYDDEGAFLRSLTVLPPVLLKSSWDYFASADEGAVEIPTTPLSALASDVLTVASRWTPSPMSGHEGPQTDAPVVQTSPLDEGVKLTWTSSATGVLGKAAYTCTMNAPIGAEYDIQVGVMANSGAAAWTVVVMESDTSGAGTGWSITKRSERYVPDGSPNVVTFRWTATKKFSRLGIEVEEPATGGWAAAQTHLITDARADRWNNRHAYGVPWVTVLDASSIDLVVVDDG